MIFDVWRRVLFTVISIAILNKISYVMPRLMFRRKYQD